VFYHFATAGGQLQGKLSSRLLKVEQIGEEVVKLSLLLNFFRHQCFKTFFVSNLQIFFVIS
jgi:hypothetical protein